MLVRLLAASCAAFALAAPAAYAENCFGTAQTYLVCLHPENVHVDPFGATVGDCFWINSDECTPVFVPVPSVTTSGPLVSTQCGTLTC